MRRAASTVALVLVAAATCLAGGPAYVAGKTGFNAGLAGTPVRWAGTEVRYYTDQGNLSALEQQGSINALVANAFSRWTNVSTAALKATRAGSLDEDVSGANVTLAGSTLTMPADIQVDSTKPMAFVYDADGKVTEALLGAGASQMCSSNFVFGGPDQFTADGHIAHALLVLNGTCVKSSADIVVLRYFLVRAIGRALGLDWSQVNDAVETNKPASPSADEIAGYPVMHPAGSLCAPVAGCAYPNADQLRMDDRMAISALYPVTDGNVSSFTGKIIFGSNTARVRGHVLFRQGAEAIAVQGANVVARLIDPVTNVPSAKVVAASVSGFRYRGNSGNIVTGYTNATGQRYDRWGGDDPSLKGYFELAGLEIPAGSTSAKYQITVELLNPDYTGAMAVGPYKNAQVGLPGTAAPMIVSVTAGSDVTQDITLEGPAYGVTDLYEPHSFRDAMNIPGEGVWSAALGEAGDVDWYAIDITGGRTFSMDVTAVAEGNGTTTNALPVIGIWDAAANESDAPLVAQTYFNTSTAGVTHVQTSLPAGSYKLAITDARGEGRPDFLYRARLLYAGSVTPAHALRGTVLTITGLGFTADVKVRVGAADAPVMSFEPGKLLVSAPLLPDGTYALTIADPETGASATVDNAVRYGGASGDTLELLSGGNPPVPVGTTAPNPFRVRVLAADSKTPVSGASVRFVSPSASVLLQPCGTQDCTVASDGGGEASVWMAVKAAGAVNLTASLAGGASVSATVSGLSAPLAVAAAPPKIYVARNSGAALPLLVRVVGDGVPLSGRIVEYAVMLGQGTLSQQYATTNPNGEATATLTIPSMNSETRVSACVGTAPQTACDIFYIYAVTLTGGTRMIKTGGDEQYVNPDAAFLPVTVRLNDLSDPPNVVAGAPVTFRMTAYKAAQSSRTVRGEVVSGHFAGAVAVASETVTFHTDGWGRASYTPHVSGSGLMVLIEATSGGASAEFILHTWQARSPATKMLMRKNRGVKDTDDF